MVGALKDGSLVSPAAAGFIDLRLLGPQAYWKEEQGGVHEWPAPHTYTPLEMLAFLSEY